MGLNKCLRTFTSISFYIGSFICSADASELILNGSFATGDLSGWIVTNSDDSGTFSASNSPVTPANGFQTIGPASGDTYYAVSDSYGPGSRALTQSFTDPLGAGGTEILSFDIFVNDQFGASGLGGEVDLLAAGADPLSGTPLAVFYSADTAVTDGIPNPFVPVTLDITADLTPGATYLLRILESDSNGPINVGVDSISLATSASTAVPEPAAFIPMSLLMAGFITNRIRRRLRGK